MAGPHLGNSRVTVLRPLEKNWDGQEALGTQRPKISSWINLPDDASEEDKQALNFFLKLGSKKGWTVGTQIQEKVGDTYLKCLSANQFFNEVKDD